MCRRLDTGRRSIEGERGKAGINLVVYAFDDIRVLEVR
jgi:hypothetical protein